MGSSLSTAKVSTLSSTEAVVRIELGEDFSRYSMPNEILLKSGGYAFLAPLSPDSSPTETSPIVWDSYQRTPNEVILHFHFLPTSRQIFVNTDLSVVVNFHGAGYKPVEVYPNQNYISVYKPWYSTWWGIIIIVLLILLLLVLVLAFPLALLTGYCSTNYSFWSPEALPSTNLSRLPVRGLQTQADFLAAQ